MARKESRLYRSVVRIVAPLVIIVIWLALSGVGGPYFGRISEVSSNDLTTFLPKNAESTKVNAELSKFRNSKTIPAIIVFESNAKLTNAERQQLDAATQSLQATGHIVGTVSKPILSTDGKAAFILAPLPSDGKFAELIPSLQKAIADTQPTLSYKLTGPAMFARDLNKAFAGIDGTLLIVALVVVFVILFIVYRSPILPIVTLLGAMFALSVAILIVWHLANVELIQLNGQVQGILFILVIGAATDYALFYIARYREELAHRPDKWTATKAAWKASWEPIVAAGGTVSLGLLCLLVSDLGSNKALGPVGGIGVMLAVLSALTFLPAVLLLLGEKAYWPRRPRAIASDGTANYLNNHRAWYRVGLFVARHPRRLWIGLTTLLLLACLFVPQLRAEGVSQNDLIIGKSEARDGQTLLDKHFPSGSGSPAYVIVPSNLQNEVVTLLDADSGIDSVSIVAADKSTAPVGKSAEALKQSIKSLAASGQAAYYPFATVPKYVDGHVLLQAVLKDPASSLDARATIERVRQTVQAKYSSVQFGGVSAVQLDTNQASMHDLKVIIPLILLVITIVLILLLRAIIAPFILLLTTVLSFGATLGVAALLFNNVWQYPGADPSVIIFGFVFLVALGIDYNIFLMSRVREEAIKHGVRAGTIKALVVTGGVISSAGVVLASTFAALYVIPILFLAQIAFIVAFGVLLDTLIVRSLLVPSLTIETGRRIWWPTKVAEKKDKA